ncbi:non-ribosomal peptide synthetase [Aspergillus puulaauensis]|uniref:Non-ribosomal peptide synthetase n=1 Tax=Aspergillus puulaauensis TaxID=1220207 RepID=A0A7R7XLN1_9EURO|nr:non-ribosomal peptide synthetase [Aspergillus puulaauensis]BCS23539.1 non-ribosomal peptide synthetase [Aspergillus puulaauensis]
MANLDHESSAVKVKLHQFAASALEIPPKRLQTKLHRTWLALGGDSLTAVFFMGACNEAGIEVDLPQILQAHSLGDLIDQIGRSQRPHEQLCNRDMAVNDAPRGYIPEDVEIDAIGPASPMQENMVARQAIEPREYQLQLTARIASVNPAVLLTTSTVEEAWKAVVCRHAALRTKFANSVDRPGRLDQVVAREIDPEINITSISAAAKAKAAFEGYSSDYSHWLSLTQQADNQVLLNLSISHALIDGVSIEIIMRDLFTFLSGTCPAAEPMQPAEFLCAQPDTSPEALSYWTRYMQKAQGSFLSSTGTGGKKPPTGLYTIDKEIAITPEVIQAFSEQSNATLANACQVAFALVLRSYTGSNNVCFSYTASGRHKRSKDLRGAAGNFVNTIPFCVELGSKTTIAEALQCAHADYLDSLPYQGASLNGNQDMEGPSVRELGDCLLSFQRGMPEAGLERIGIAVEVVSWEAPTDYNYTLAISIEKQRLGLRLTTWETVCSRDAALNVLQLFIDSMDFVQRHTNEPWSRFRGLTTRDQGEIIAMNKSPYPLMQECVHDLVWHTRHRQPDSVAVCAWDGELTYRELCDFASQLAARLGELGAKVEDRIGVCMDKSRWAPVVILGILQAGGAVLPLGNQHPPLHIQTIVRNADISILIADPSHAKRLGAHVAHTVTVDDKYFGQGRPPTPTQQMGRRISPDNAAWIVHTSGSTGVPKAVVLEHKTLCSPMAVQAARYNMGPWTRALQFSAHTFDVCVKDIFTTLAVGGCVCIPSEEQRLDHLGLVMTNMKVNFASLTPTVASLLHPQDVPLLDTLVLTGEALSPGVVREWLDDGRVKLYNAYGPSECSHVSTINGPLTRVEDTMIIGFPAANRLWVADADNFNRLSPIGGVGELLIEGSIAREYLHDPERSAAAFVTDPVFVTMLGLQPGRRMYRTGDLVRQTADGSLEYLGRRDTQIKVRGQRVDVGGIESRISQLLTGRPLVCVDLVQLRNAPSESSMLMAAIDMHGAPSHKNSDSMPWNICEPSQALIDLLHGLDSQLVDCLPQYMVPTHYVPFVSLPMNTSGKLDRRKTRALLEALTGNQLGAFKQVAGRATISTETERKLQVIWADVLRCPVADIGGDTHFRHVGGDSVVAMRMAGIARRTGISLSVAEIVQHPRLSEMARVVDGHGSMNQRVASNDPLPFSLWKGFPSASAEDQRARLASLAIQCNVHPSEIEDVYPTTALQEGLMAATTRSP